MKILIATDVVLYKYKNHYYLSSAFGTILKRYYENFGKAIICSRVYKQVPPNKFFCVDDYIDEVIPDTQLDALLRINRKRLKNAIKKCDLIIGRCPSMIAYSALKIAKKMKKKTYAEVIGDPWDAYWNHSLKGKLIAPYMFFAAKKHIKSVDYALYVTNEFLQKRYPCKNQSIGISDVQIDNIEESILRRRLEKIKNMNPKELTIVTTAAVNVRYKGQQYMIKAIPKLNSLGIRIKYIMIGGGNQEYLKRISIKAGVSDQVEFTGFLSIAEVLTILDNADIYIQPSLQEGLPRAMVEAMSRGCPCIGAKTAGIPELISSECIVKRKSSKNISDTIVKICNTEKMIQLSNINFDKSKDFLNIKLSNKRNAFYTKIKEQVASYDKYTNKDAQKNI